VDQPGGDGRPGGREGFGAGGVLRKSRHLEAPSWEEISRALTDPEAGLCAHSARFTRGEAVEHICAISGGRLDIEEVTAVAGRFLASDLAVRLTPDDQPGRRKTAQWSTAAHRAAEDRTVPLADSLAARTVPAIMASAVTEAPRTEPGLGSDQTAAIMMLTDGGPGARCVLAPAGYGNNHAPDRGPKPQTARLRRLGRDPGRPARPRRGGRSCVSPPARSYPGRSLRSLDGGPATA
jgi:hypothetical protein